ncbi:uncharacterized protein LOC141702590 [Apium graveolens]|uniref:uncharacterized protein LOC141702590 n=1 Tax=Apium graveolens TaxID=4045 RepID=UPI003D7B4D6B
MKTKCQGNARVKKAQLNRLRRNFEVLEMQRDEPVADYFSRVMIIANDMRNCGEDMHDSKIVEKILRTLTDKWNFIVCSIEESKDIGELSVDTLQSSLLVHEQKFKYRNNEEEQALKITHEAKYSSRGRGRVSYRGGRGGGGEADKHLTKPQLNVTSVILLNTIHMSVQGGRRGPTINHMCGDHSIFNDIDESFKHVVRLGNNAKMDVSGKENVKLWLKGTSFILSDVYYVPELKNPLISIGQLQEKGLDVLFRSNQCRIYHPSRGLLIQANMTAN